MARLLSALLLAGAAVAPAQASMAAWWTSIGPQVILLNETTNQIRYSACNMDGGQAKYSYTDGSVFSLSYPPRVGTPVAGVGWWNEKITIASIFYINDQGNITNGLFNCNMTTGLFQSQGQWVISSDVPSIHSNSGMNAIVLGAEAGYRVYFHDGDGAINELGYTTAQNWKYRGVISKDINSLPALGAAFSGDKNISVASPRDESNMAVVRLNKDDTWFRTTLPHPLKGNFSVAETNRTSIAVNTTAATNFTLPGWDGRTRSIGVTIDQAYTRFLWYIGNDSSLHSVANQNFTWRVRNNTSNASWPDADSPNADLAVAYNFQTSMVRLYYFVKGQLSEVRFQNGTWHPATALPPPPPRPSVSTTSSPDDSSSSSGLSTGAKAGIGVGVSLGAIALGAIIAVIVLARRRQHQQTLPPPSDATSPSAADEGSTTLSPDTPALSYGSPTTTAGAAQYEGGYVEKAATEYPQQLDSTPRSELFVAPMYELPSQPYTHELEVAQPVQQPVQKQ